MNYDKRLLAVLLAVTIALPAVYLATSVTNTTNETSSKAIGNERSASPALSQTPANSPNRPRGLTFQQLEAVTLEEAQSRVNFRVTIPDNLPPGFSIKAVIATKGSKETYKGVEFYPDSVEMLFSNKPAADNTTVRQALEAGGIWIREAYSLGENTTAPFEAAARGSRSARITYLWGYPALVSPEFIKVYQFEKKIAYTVEGKYSEEVLMKIMESTIRG